jgi:hypothetical protein
MTEQDNDVFEEAGPSSSDRDPEPASHTSTRTHQEIHSPSLQERMEYKTDDQIMQRKYEQQTAQKYSGHRRHLSPEVKAWVKRQ